jgi:hypothetical protein
VNAAIARLAGLTGPGLGLEVKTVAQDLLMRLPEGGKMYLEQMMYSAYCSALRDDRMRSEGERAALIQAYNREVRHVLVPPARDINQADASRPSPTISMILVSYGGPNGRCAATDFFRRECDGKAICAELISNAMCGDPSPGTSKDGRVHYVCMRSGTPLPGAAGVLRGVTVPEHGSAHLSCLGS